MTARQRRRVDPVWSPPDQAVALDPADEPHWSEFALCAETDPEAFYPEKGGSTTPAKKVCMACEVRTECLEYALEHQERFGIWGGKSERQRRALAKERAAAETEAEVAA